jgi:hypothetical protein
MEWFSGSWPKRTTRHVALDRFPLLALRLDGGGRGGEAPDKPGVAQICVDVYTQLLPKLDLPNLRVVPQVLRGGYGLRLSTGVCSFYEYR